jgi:predicted nucleic acid-binding protein
MAHYLADTSLIIDLINDQSGRREFIKQLLQAEENLHCCTINVIEVFAGMRKGEEQLTTQWFDQFSYHDVTREIAQESGILLYQWRKKGKTLSLADATIAAVAIHYGLVLLTDNGRHFPMPELLRHPLPAAPAG